MDINKLQPIKLSPCAREKVINDFFPNFIDDDHLNKESLDSRALPLHAGALCLYTATLLTKIYENNPEAIQLESNDRELALRELIKRSAKFSHLTDSQVAEVAHEMIIKDIRNSFAHGNFKISYDIYSKKLYFVLTPVRKDFRSDIPIVISKESLLKANKQVVARMGLGLKALGDAHLNSVTSSSMGNLLKSFVSPTKMIQLADNYFDKKYALQKTKVDERMYFLVDYMMLLSKIVYEQDDYYNIFGKDSNIFQRIALIRNSLAHDSFSLIQDAKEVNYQDRQKSLKETFIKSVTTLITVNKQKELIQLAIYKQYDPEIIQELTDALKETFDLLFNQEDNTENE